MNLPHVRSRYVRRLRQAAVAVTVAVVAVAAVVLPTAASAQDPDAIDHRYVAFREVHPHDRGFPLPPAIAGDPDRHHDLWVAFGFTDSRIGIPDGEGGFKPPPPPPPPEVDFDREVALYMVTGRVVEQVTRHGDTVIVDLRATPNAGGGIPPTGWDVQILGLARDQLPDVPFTLVQRHDGEEEWRVTIGPGFAPVPEAATAPPETATVGVLPRTGPPAGLPPLLPAAAAAAVALAAGVWLLARTRTGRDTVRGARAAGWQP